MDKGRMRVGLVYSRAREGRSLLRCYRCHATGNVARDCRGVDRSSSCRCCGKTGHLPKGCDASREEVVAFKRETANSAANSAGGTTRLAGINVGTWSIFYKQILVNVAWRMICWWLLRPSGDRIFYLSLSQIGLLAFLWMTGFLTRQAGVRAIAVLGNFPIDEIGPPETGFPWVAANGLQMYSCYCSPNASDADFESFIGKLEASIRSAGYDVIVAGEFNSKSLAGSLAGFGLWLAWHWIKLINHSNGIACAIRMRQLSLINIQ